MLHSELLERMTEVAVLISLFAAGLKLGLPLSDKRWRMPLRLAFVSMTLTVGLIAVIGVYGLDLPLGAAVLLGGILAPTDPVLASDVQVTNPADSDRLRFSLTAEGGLNDGAAFPFVMLGLGMLGLHELGAGAWRWVAFDVIGATGGGLLIGAALGALVGPFALRLRGQYLVVVTLGLVFLAEHVFRNWRGLTGGNNGRAIDPPATLGVNFNDFNLGGFSGTRAQSWFWLIWAVVAIVALVAANLARSRAGRALQAIRDRDLAAELTGVDLARTKVAVFALSSGLAALAGALLGAYQEFVSPTDWNLVLSIQYIAIIIVGGLGSVYGPILGAIFVGSLPRIIEEYSDSIPGVAGSAGDDGFITVFALNQMLFGLLIIGFLILEPRGLTALAARVRTKLTNTQQEEEGS
jgi:ABC-type branched-subunit amino acid transport system permease subunit